MNEQEALSRMIAPGTPRPGKYRTGVIQIWVTRACDKSCFGCTQGSNLGGRLEFMPPTLFEQAVISLKGYFGVVGVFGGNPALHPQFEEICHILQDHIPREQRGIWSNNPMTLANAMTMRQTFDPSVSNLNVHQDAKAYDMFKQGWPECSPVGLTRDSRHSPPYVALKDVIDDEGKRWELISDCDINKHWSAMIGVFRGELRAWFCEIAGAQAMLHQDEPNYPDTGRELWFYPEENLNGEIKLGGIELPWWTHSMASFRQQVRKHCHDCGIPLRGYGELANARNEEGREQVSKTHEGVYKPKRKGRAVELVTLPSQLEPGKIDKVIDYLGNAKR
jgi:hypothetical protein